MTQQQRPSFAQQAARFSFWAPFVAMGLNFMMGPVSEDSRATGLLISTVASLMILSGLVMAIYALLAMRKHGRKGILGYAVVGVVINGLVVASTVMMIPVIQRAAALRNGMTKAEVDQIPKMIAGSTEVFDERIGYRIEIPPGFSTDAEGAQRFAYAFAKDNPDGSRVVINIDHLGGLIANESLSAYIDSVRNQFPEGTEVSLVHEEWDGYQVEGFQQSVNVNGVPISVICADPIVSGIDSDQCRGTFKQRAGMPSASSTVVDQC